MSRGGAPLLVVLVASLAEVSPHPEPHRLDHLRRIPLATKFADVSGRRRHPFSVYRLPSPRPQ